MGVQNFNNKHEMLVSRELFTKIKHDLYRTLTVYRLLHVTMLYR